MRGALPPRELPRLEASKRQAFYNRRSVSGMGREGIFSLHHRVQTCSGAHPGSCPMGTVDSFPGGKAADT
jgi:hypothetical protein